MNNNSRFSDGFLLGALVGGMFVFLLGTEKGKKLLKVITQEGEGALATFLEDLEAEHEEEVEKPKKVEVLQEANHKELNFEEHINTNHQSSNSVVKEKAPARRFFKRK